MLRLFLAVVCVIAPVIGCDDQSSSTSSTPSPAARSGGDDEDEAMTNAADGAIGKGKEAPLPNLRSAAKSPQFQAAANTVAQLTGDNAPEALEDEETGTEVGGLLFACPHATAERLIAGPARKQLLAQGAYLVRHDNSYNIGDAKDVIALLPTTDKYVVLAAVQTNGANFDIMTGDIIDWLKEMEKTQPFELTEAGFDYLAGQFTTPLKDPAAMAKRMYDFCPDIVDQGTGEVDKLAAELKKGRFFFWWD
jgi:hypothetical protein